MAVALPTGTVTFLFTDIEASTARWERDARAMAEALRRHDGILRESVAANAGVVFKTVGDAFCCAFARAEDAVAAAAAARARLDAEDFFAVDGLRVRMAVHAGSADERDADYFGPSVNRVARLLAIAHGGQTILSSIVAGLVAANLPAGTFTRNLGTHRLKDLAQPENVFELVPGERSAPFPPLRSLGMLDHNLPLQITGLVGRDADLGEIRRLVEAHRLVTIVGTGGVGKTRAALAAGAEMLDGTGDGVWFADLAPLSDPSLVAGACAAALGVRLVPEAEQLEHLVAALQRRRLLLIVDNCEHLIGEAARVVAAILRECPSVHVIATSREALKIDGERVYRLPSLALPPPAARTAAEVADYEACALFIVRAAAADASFRCTDDNAAAIVEIARRLDGIPLALELAAARSRVLPPQQLAKRLDERFRLLSLGSRIHLPRQQTMRALIDWSFDTLSDAERRVLRRCAVFANGWALEAAESVCAFDGIDAPDVVEIVASLVDKSLVDADVEAQTARFRFLESIRAYAAEKLDEAGERESCARRHAHWVRAFFAAQDGSSGNGRDAWRDVRPETDNLRAAILWALGEGDVRLAGHIVVAAQGVWYDADLQAEGRRFAEQVLATIPEDDEPKLAAELWLVIAQGLVAEGMIAGTRRAIALSERTDTKKITAVAQVFLGYGLWQSGRASEAEVTLGAALESQRGLGLERSRHHALALDMLANVMLSLQRIDEARALFQRALVIYESVGNRIDAARVQGNLAEAEFAAGHPDRALERIAVAEAVFRESRAVARVSVALVNSAAYLLALERIEDACNAAHEGLVLARRVEDVQATTIAIQHIATVAATLGDAERAAKLIGYVDAWYRRHGYEREENERIGREKLARALAALLTPEAIAGFLKTGATWSSDDVATSALAIRYGS